MQKVARSTNAVATSTKFDIDLGQARTIGVAALVVHNISVSGTVRITASDTNTFTTLYYDSGDVAVWPSGQIPLNLLEWEDDNYWLGTLSQQARAGYQSPYIHILPTSKNMLYWRVEVKDTVNSDGYIQIGRLFLAAGWTPSINYSYGAGLGYEDPTISETSLGGAEFFDVRPRFRSFSFGLNYITSTEAYSSVMDLQRMCGNSGEVLVVPDQSDTTNQPARAFVGRLRQIGKITQPTPTAFNVDFELKELL